MITKEQQEELELLEKKTINRLNQRVLDKFDIKLEFLKGVHSFYLREGYPVDKQVIQDRFEKEDILSALKEAKSINYCSGDEGTLYLSIDIDRDWLHENDENWDSYVALQNIAEDSVLDILEEYREKEQSLLKEFYKDKSFDESIPFKIKDDLDIGKDIASLREWKARIKIGNNVGSNNSPQLGDWDFVRYVLVGVKTNTILPVARGDEHHQGLDLAHEYQEKGLIPEDVYIALSEGDNYIYNHDSEEDIQLYRNAIELWLKYKGDNAILYFTELRVKVDFRTFIRETKSGKVIDYLRSLEKQSQEELLPIGKKIIKLFGELSLEFNKKLSNKPFKEDRIYNKALELAHILEDSFYDSKLNTAIEAIKSAENSLDLQKMEEAIFSFDGAKNVIHIKLKKLLEEERLLGIDKEFPAVFGSLKVALEKMDGLSS